MTSYNPLVVVWAPSRCSFQKSSGSSGLHALLGEAYQSRDRFVSKFASGAKKLTFRSDRCTRLKDRWSAFFLLLASLWIVLPANLQSLSQSSALPAEAGAKIANLARQKQWKDVAVLGQELALKSPYNPYGFYWLGTARFQLHDPIRAVQAFRVAERLGLDSSVLDEDLGLAYYDLNQFVLFEQQMRKAFLQDPRDYRPPYYLGLYRLTIKSDIDGALTEFDKAIQLQPDDWKSLYQEGNCLEKLGRSTEARQYYSRAISSVRGSDQPFGWPFQGMARLLLETDPQEAVGFAKKAVEVQPDEYSNHLVLARVYKRLGNLPLAIQEAKLAAVQNPEDAATRYLLFMLYRQAGEHHASEIELEMFKKLNSVYGPE